VEICPICNRETQAPPVERGSDYIIYRCSYCGGDFPHIEHLIDYNREYLEDKDTFQVNRKLRASQDLKDIYREAELTINFKYALDFLKATSSKGKLLDIGCGVGVFPKLVEDTGFDVYALDPAEQAVRYARDNFGLQNVLAGTIDDVPPAWGDFNFITLFEVLEHVERPRELVQKIYELLAPGGYFIVSVPNRDRLEVKLGRRGLLDYPPNHLTRWSRQVLGFMLTDIGFEDIATEVDGVNRWTLTATFLPQRLNLQIERKKIETLTEERLSGDGFFIHSPIWMFAQRMADVFAFLLQKLVGRRYGQYLIGFARKPDS